MVNDQSKQIEGLMSTVKDQSQQIKLLMSKVKEQSQQLERQGLILKMYLAPLELKIPNFQAICERAKATDQFIPTEAFYLFKCGYRYLLKIKVGFPSYNPYRLSVFFFFLYLSIQVVSG